MLALSGLLLLCQAQITGDRVTVFVALRALLLVEAEHSHAAAQRLSGFRCPRTR